MCTIVVKAFKEIPAITMGHANFLHDPNGIDPQSCQAIITSASCMHDESFSYTSIMPDWLTQAFFNPELQRQRLNVQQYRENDNFITMRIMDDLHLADFVGLQLKSKHDFDAAYDVALSAGLGDYVRRFVVIQPGDWPCQFYCRQIIYRCLKNLQGTIQSVAISLQTQIWSFHITILHIPFHPLQLTQSTVSLIT